MAGEWVLVTADGKQLRDPLLAVRALAEAGYRPAVAVSAGSSLATASRYCERVVHVPSPHGPDFAPAVREELAAGGYLTVLPASEAALLALGAPEHLVDKVQLAARGAAVGVPAPPSRVFPGADAVVAAARDFDYPVIVKPAVHRFNAVRVDSPLELAGRVGGSTGALMVQPFVDDLHALSGVMWKGELIAATHERWLRIWPYHCGVSTAAETVVPDPDLEHRMTQLLEGYDGLFHAQFAGPYLIDLNLRVHTSHPLSIAAGANMVGLWCDLLRGDDVVPVRARPGVPFRWVEADVRHLVTAVRRGDLPIRSALQCLTPRRGTAHSTESLRDPGPMAARMGHLVGQVAQRVAG